MWVAAWVTVVAWLALAGVPASSTSCPPEELTVYKVALDTHWSPRDFPKHYPEWRPPAQWSKLLGEWNGSTLTSLCHNIRPECGGPLL